MAFSVCFPRLNMTTSVRPSLTCAFKECVHGYFDLDMHEAEEMKLFESVTSHSEMSTRCDGIRSWTRFLIHSKRKWWKVEKNWGHQSSMTKKEITKEKREEMLKCREERKERGKKE